MAYMPGTFKASFWETDFLTQTGFDTLITHIKEGQKSCKWLEDYLKQRAKAEDDYAKALLKIAKTNTSEFGSLRKAMEELRIESETEATLHASVAQKITEESTKLAEFREKQREERKRNEEIVHRSHKNKADLYRRMQSCKATYENRFKAAEKAESDADKLKFGSKPKDAEKARKTAHQCRGNAVKADEEYKNSVNAVETARQTWVKDHSESCEELQRMEEDRIMFLRNSMWVFTNLISDLCCRLDDSREKIRLVAEQCDEQADVREFATLKSTCISPLQPIEYTPCGAGGSQSPQTQLMHNGASHIYEVDEEPGSQQVFTALYDYPPNSPDELELKAGDKIKKLPNTSTEPGWYTGLNVRTQATGLFPTNYVH